MNRKKKINQTLLAKDKKKKAKLNGNNKPKYLSKAEREKLAVPAALEGTAPADETPPASAVTTTVLETPA